MATARATTATSFSVNISSDPPLGVKRTTVSTVTQGARPTHPPFGSSRDPDTWFEFGCAGGTGREPRRRGRVSLEDRSFAGPTAVGRYWIAHAEGFAVHSPSGRPLGVVRSVAVDPRTAEPLLVVDRPSLIG